VSLAELTGGQVRAGAIGGLIAARIATTASDESDDVYVLIGATQQRTGPCLWMPRDGVFPTRDDPCFVQQAALGQWIVQWWRPA
jgi:hypothetical protein